MRMNLVGRSWVSAITHTPASGPFGPVTTPAMSEAPIERPWAARGHAGRFAARPTIITWTDQRRIVFISPSVYVHPSWLSLYEVTLDLDNDRSELRHAAAPFGPHDPEPTVRRCDHAEIVTEPVAGGGRHALRRQKGLTAIQRCREGEHLAGVAGVRDAIEPGHAEYALVADSEAHDACRARVDLCGRHRDGIGPAFAAVVGMRQDDRTLGATTAGEVQAVGEPAWGAVGREGRQLEVRRRTTRVRDKQRDRERAPAIGRAQHPCAPAIEAVGVAPKRPQIPRSVYERHYESPAGQDHRHLRRIDQVIRDDPDRRGASLAPIA